MKKFILFLALIPPAVFFLFNHQKPEQKKRSHSTGQENPFQRLQWEHGRLADPATGEVPAMGIWNAYQQLVSDGRMISSPFYSQAHLRDGSWQQVNDFFSSIAITKMVYDPNNTQTYYFCTGEGWYGIGMAIGAGVFKSLDAGNSWNQLTATAIPGFSYCQDIDVHPATSDVYVATQTSGLMRSQDGGATWKRVLSVPGPLNNSVCDVEITKNGGIFATTGIFQQGAIWYSESGDSGTWVKKVNGFPSTGIYRVEIATAASNDSVAYATACRAVTYDIAGVFKTIDKGENWFLLPPPGGSDTMMAHFQAWYDLLLEVNPADENEVIGGGWHLWRSKDGGNNWTQLSHGDPFNQEYQYVHVDQHAVVFRNSDTVLFGNDGGVWKSGNFSDDFPALYERNNGYRVTQYYAGSVHPGAGNGTVVGGTQDNGSTLINQGGISPVLYLTGYDGGFCAINPQDPSLIYTTKNSNGVFRKSNFGYSIADTLTNPYINDNDVQFINPIALDATDPEILYMSSNQGLWRLSQASTASDSDWVQASKLQTAISVLAVSPAQPHTVFAGKNSSAKIYRLENADTSGITRAWINCDPANKLPNGSFGNPISCAGLYLNPTDANHLLSVYSNYGIKNVWESKNVLASSPAWTSHDGDLPNIPVFSVFVHPDQPTVCYIGTSLGVFFTSQLNGDNTHWELSNDGLANVRITQLIYKPTDQTLTAMTYGRGIFVGTVPAAGPDYSISWTERGPLDVGGRTRALMIDPNDPAGQTVWAGAVSGGLWKTTHIDALPFVGIQNEAAAEMAMNIFPNPAGEGTVTIELMVEKSSVVSVKMIDREGKPIADLCNQRHLSAGKHWLRWNTSSVPNGIYFAETIIDGKRLVKKVAVMK